MRYVVDSQVVLLRPPEGPLASHIAAFAKSVSDQGYCLYSIKRQVYLVACFSRWLRQRGIAACGIHAEHAAQFIRYRARHTPVYGGDHAAVMRVIVLLRGEGVIPVERNSTCKLSAVERCVQAYEQYLREARALARATIVNYVPFIRTGCVRHLMFLSHAGE